MLYLRKKKIKKCKNAYLLWKPQTKWIIQKVTTMTPKKPNSATRKVIKVKLTTWKFSYVYIPGIGHNLKKFCTVLIKGWRTQDLPWLKLKAMRWHYDFNTSESINRSHARTKFYYRK